MGSGLYTVHRRLAPREHFRLPTGCTTDAQIDPARTKTIAGNNDREVLFVPLNPPDRFASPLPVSPLPDQRGILLIPVGLESRSSAHSGDSFSMPCEAAE